MPILKQVSRGADLYFTFRFLRLLTMKWTKTDAYKYKIIDAKGKVLRKSSELESVDEKAAYTMFHRLVYKMRRLLEKIPIIGKTILTNYAAALLLLKEQNNTRIWTDENYLEQRLMEFLKTDWEEDAKFLKEEMDNMDKKGFREFLAEEIDEAKQGHALVVDGEVVARGNKKQLLKKVKKDGIKIDHKDNFLAYTGKEVGDSWAEEVEIVEKNNWAVIDTAPSAVDRKKNEIMAVATDEKDAYDSIKYSEGPRGYQSGAGKSKKTLKVVRIKKKYDIGDVFKEGIDIEKASMKDVIKDFQSSDAPQFKGKSDKKKKEMAIAAKLSSESVEKTMKPKILSFNEYNLDEMSAGLQLKMAFDDAKIKIKGTKGGKLVIAKKDEKKVEKVIAKQMRKPADAKRVLGSQIVFEDVELDEKRKAADDVGMECQECLHKFRHKNPIYGKTKCPKCKSTDLDLAFGEAVELDEYAGTKKRLKMKKKAGWGDDVELEKKVPKLKFKHKSQYSKPQKKDKKKSSEPTQFAFGISRKGGSGAGKGYGSAKKAPILMGEDELDEGSSDTADMYALMVKGMKAVPGSPKQKEIIKQINVIRKRLGMKPMSEEFELNEEFSEKDFDALKKGDTITIEFKSPMSSGKATFKVTAKNIVGKARVEKATLKDVKRPGGVKFFLYKRGNKVSLAQGDMAASVVKYTVDEEAPTNSAGGGAIAGLDIGLTHKKKQEDEKKAKALKKMMVGESVKMATFAGKDVFIVDSDMFHNCRMGKQKYHRYEKYVGSKRIGQAIREYGLKFPKRPIILQNGENGPMLYLRYGGK